MYGLVNKAIRDMVCSDHGEATWHKIRERASVTEDHFLGMEAYPDDLTVRLIGAATEVLGLDAASVMRAFGRYWVTYTATEGYGELLTMAGDTLPEFLGNLDELHARVGVNFPKLVPPAFECEEPSDGQILLHYYSKRQGLGPMVMGLVEGLGERFDCEVEIEQTISREQGADHDVFSIRYTPRSK